MFAGMGGGHETRGALCLSSVVFAQLAACSLQVAPAFIPYETTRKPMSGGFEATIGTGPVYGLGAEAHARMGIGAARGPRIGAELSHVVAGAGFVLNPDPPHGVGFELSGELGWGAPYDQWPTNTSARSGGYLGAAGTLRVRAWPRNRDDYHAGPMVAVEWILGARAGAWNSLDGMLLGEFAILTGLRVAFWTDLIANRTAQRSARRSQ